MTHNNELRDQLAEKEGAPYHETAPARIMAFKNGWDAREQHVHGKIFDLYHQLKEAIGELGYNNFIHSKEVEEYREWLRNDKYKHRIEWFEKKYPNGLYYKDEEGMEYGVRIITKQFLAEADAAYAPPPNSNDIK